MPLFLFLFPRPLGSCSFVERIATRELALAPSRSANGKEPTSPAFSLPDQRPDLLISPRHPSRIAACFLFLLSKSRESLGVTSGEYPLGTASHIELFRSVLDLRRSFYRAVIRPLRRGDIVISPRILQASFSLATFSLRPKSDAFHSNPPSRTATAADNDDDARST